MVSKKTSERPKLKPRGRPFVKGNRRGKLEGGVLDASGRESGIDGGTIAPEPNKSIVEQTNKEIKPMEKQDQSKVEVLEHKEGLTAPTSTEVKSNEEEGVKIIESLDFKDDKGNCLKIVYSATPARRYRLQVFLNDSQEIRPVTYNGTSTATAFWSMLKGTLKK